MDNLVCYKKKKNKQHKKAHTMAFESKIKQPADLRDHYAYVVNRPFYGRDPNRNKELREYSREEVKGLVKQALPQRVILQDAISRDVTLLIVPDHWDLKLPVEARNYSFIYIPFSLILWPRVTSMRELEKLRAPVDADLQLLRKHSEPVFPNGSFELDKIPDSDILKRFRSFTYDAALPTVVLHTAPTPSMHPTHPTHPIHPTHPTHPTHPMTPMRTKKGSLKKSRGVRTMTANTNAMDAFNTGMQRAQTHISNAQGVSNQAQSFANQSRTFGSGFVANADPMAIMTQANQALGQAQSASGQLQGLVNAWRPQQQQPFGMPQQTQMMAPPLQQQPFMQPQQAPFMMAPQPQQQQFTMPPQQQFTMPPQQQFMVPQQPQTLGFPQQQMMAPPPSAVVTPQQSNIATFRPPAVPPTNPASSSFWDTFNRNANLANQNLQGMQNMAMSGQNMIGGFRPTPAAPFSPNNTMFLQTGSPVPQINPNSNVQMLSARAAQMDAETREAWEQLRAFAKQHDACR